MRRATHHFKGAAFPGAAAASPHHNSWFQAQMEASAAALRKDGALPVAWRHPRAPRRSTSRPHERRAALVGRRHYEKYTRSRLSARQRAGRAAPPSWNRRRRPPPCDVLGDTVDSTRTGALAAVLPARRRRVHLDHVLEHVVVFITARTSRRARRRGEQSQSPLGLLCDSMRLGRTRMRTSARRVALLRDRSAAVSAARREAFLPRVGWQRRLESN